MNITVVIPTIPGREHLLNKALSSVHRQTLTADAIVVEHDRGRTGAPAARTRAMEHVTTEWTAFLDDDDEMLPDHLETLASAADHADYVFSDFRVPEAPGFRLASFCYGPFDPERPLQTTITILARTSLIREFGFRLPPAPAMICGDAVGEDYWLTHRAAKAGRRIVHVPKVTWLWHHWGGNTSGLAA